MLIADILVWFLMNISNHVSYTVELQWLKYLWNCEIVLDIGSSSHCGLIIALAHEANGNNLGEVLLIFYKIVVC